jgi:hypothetical protein
MADWRMKGQYLKNCNCVAGCPCDTWGYPAPNDNCEGFIGMNITEGHFDGTDLSGLKWAAVVWWPGALHDGNGSTEMFIDESASEEQRNALVQILSGQAGGPLFEIFASIITTVHGPHFVPIDFDFDKEKRTARMAVPSAETTSRPLVVPATDEEQRVIVQLPEGFEYRDSEVAQAETLKSEGEIKYEWQETHSTLAEVEHTPEGLAA